MESDNNVHRLGQTEVEPKLVAIDDEYVVDQDESLELIAPGVLDNDTILVEGSVRAVLIIGPANGELLLNGDGSFTYTPLPTYTGTYTFSYIIEQGLSQSNEALVSITVNDTQPPEVEWKLPVSDRERYDVEGEVIPLEVTATDNGDIDAVVYYRWDAVNEEYVDIGIVNSEPYILEFDTGILNPEWNEVFVRVYDEAGNISERTSIWLYLSIESIYYLPVIMLEHQESATL